MNDCHVFMYLEFASLVSLAGLFLQPGAVEFGSQEGHRRLFVLDLGALLLALRHCA